MNSSLPDGVVFNKPKRTRLTNRSGAIRNGNETGAGRFQPEVGACGCDKPRAPQPASSVTAAMARAEMRKVDTAISAFVGPGVDE
jgi:hypothetical protein